MTRRAVHRQKLLAAAEAARDADGWIGGTTRATALAAAIGSADANRHGAALLAEPRLRARFPGFANALADAMATAPRLGDALADPERLYHLSLLAGAGLTGGAMARLVGRAAVGELVAALGEDVWAYGVAEGRTPLAPVRTPDAMIDLLQRDGAAAVVTYLDGVAPGLGQAAGAAAGLPSVPPPTDLETAKAAVEAALEHVVS